MDAFEYLDLLAQRTASGQRYLEFLRKASMSAGLYVLPAGAVDGQQPHSEDELYYVIFGQGQIDVNGEHRPVQAGSTIFVAARVPHHFHSITEELRLLVLFAPPESAGT